MIFTFLHFDQIDEMCKLTFRFAIVIRPYYKYRGRTDICVVVLPSFNVLRILLSVLMYFNSCRGDSQGS